MTDLANTHRMDKQFQIGDMVYVRLRDFRQHSVHSRAIKKLSNRFYGPFPIAERIGNVAYRLTLPPKSRIHPVFHVSLLRQAYGNPTVTPLPEIGHSELFPAKILNYRKLHNSIQVLVTWNNTAEEEATWETFDEFKARFPDFYAQDNYTLQLEDELNVEKRAVDTPQQASPIIKQINDIGRPKRVKKIPNKLLD
uniref:Tf2-1-like SH3-like domain-containing protein n=1 Tax=Tanacetum cinerariifolium TaxID=118510 RepID=A0A699HI19_TANCI|nr:hypothetical protein [Tanacetum cinerariifolium]